MEQGTEVGYAGEAAMIRRTLPWVLVALVAITVIVLVLVPRGSAAVAQPPLAGTVLEARPAAPPIRLSNQFGRPVSLAQFRGRPVVVTFLSAACTTLCPLVAERLRQTLVELGSAGRRVAILAVSTDPTRDTRQVMLQFSRRHHLLHRWQYLTGPRARVSPVWKHYYIYAAPANAPAAVRDAHTSATYLIDGQGRERVLIAGVPQVADLRRDLLILSGLPPGSLAGTVAAPEIGHPAPDFALQSLSGKTVRLSDFRGKTVLLNFWATWCHPCRTEAPLLSRWYQRLRGKGFVVLGVDQQEGAADVGAFVRTYHLSYPIVLDASGAVSAKYDVPGLPKSLLIDSSGFVEAVRLGAVDTQFLSSRVVPLVSGQNVG